MSRFDKVAKEWDSSERRQAMAADIANAIFKTQPLAKTMRLLDFGAGTGLLSKHLCSSVGHITALDISKEMLKQLEANRSTWGPCEVETVHSDITKFKTTLNYNGIVSSMSMHHIENIDLLFETFARVLSPNGFIAIADLELEDGTFHEDGNEGVFHFGFEEETLRQTAEKYGFTTPSFQTVHCVEKEENKAYNIFLMHAFKQ